MGMAGFQARPAETRNPGQANTVWVTAGSLAQLATMETFPLVFRSVSCLLITLASIASGLPERLLHARVPVQIPVFRPRDWKASAGEPRCGWSGDSFYN